MLCISSGASIHKHEWLDSHLSLPLLAATSNSIPPCVAEPHSCVPPRFPNLRPQYRYQTQVNVSLHLRITSHSLPRYLHTFQEVAVRGFVLASSTNSMRVLQTPPCSEPLTKLTLDQILIRQRDAGSSHAITWRWFTEASGKRRSALEMSTSTAQTSSRMQAF